MPAITPEYKFLLDPAVPPANGVQYIGAAQPNTLTAENAWAIMRLTYVTSEISEVLWASGTSQFTQIWDDRAALSYS